MTKLQEFRKKPVVIKAVQWFKNGDHPFDYKAEPRTTEAQVVRRFHHPDMPSNSKCSRCKEQVGAHGWIDTLEGGHRVCPADWIITGIQGEYYPCKPDIFEKTYDIEINIQKTKPSIDWSHLADSVNGMATDSDGKTYLFSHRPDYMEGVWIMTGIQNGAFKYPVYPFDSFKPGDCTPGDSLVMRPGCEEEPL